MLTEFVLKLGGSSSPARLAREMSEGTVGVPWESGLIQFKSRNPCFLKACPQAKPTPLRRAPSICRRNLALQVSRTASGLQRVFLEKTLN